MLLLKILILVWTLRLVALHIGFCMAKAWLASLILVLISWLLSPVDVIGAQLGEFFNVFQVFSINHDWVVHSSVLPLRSPCEGCSGDGFGGHALIYIRSSDWHCVILSSYYFLLCASNFFFIFIFFSLNFIRRLSLYL